MAFSYSIVNDPNAWADYSDRNSNIHFANVWLQTYASAAEARFECAEAMKEADAVLARYKEIYNGK